MYTSIDKGGKYFVLLNFIRSSFAQKKSKAKMVHAILLKLKCCFYVVCFVD